MLWKLALEVGNLSSDFEYGCLEGSPGYCENYFRLLCIYSEKRRDFELCKAKLKKAEPYCSSPKEFQEAIRGVPEELLLGGTELEKKCYEGYGTACGQFFAALKSGNDERTSISLRDPC